MVLNRLTREQLLAYLYLLTGLLPTDRLPSLLDCLFSPCHIHSNPPAPCWLSRPRFLKSELLESIAVEYANLGRPMDAQTITPEQALQLVSDAFNSPTAPGGSTASSAFGTSSGATPGVVADEGGMVEEASYADYIYTCECQDGQWTLNAWDAEANLVAQASMPAPAEGFYYITMQDGVMSILLDEEVMPCATFMENLAAAPPDLLPAGVSVPVPPGDDEDQPEPT